MSSHKLKQLKRQHNRIKRRLALGDGKPDDRLRLQTLKRELGYA